MQMMVDISPATIIPMLAKNIFSCMPLLRLFSERKGTGGAKGIHEKFHSLIATKIRIHILKIITHAYYSGVPSPLAFFVIRSSEGATCLFESDATHGTFDAYIHNRSEVPGQYCSAASLHLGMNEAMEHMYGTSVDLRNQVDNSRALISAVQSLAAKGNSRKFIFSIS